MTFENTCALERHAYAEIIRLDGDVIGAIATLKVAFPHRVHYEIFTAIVNAARKLTTRSRYIDGILGD